MKKSPETLLVIILSISLLFSVLKCKHDTAKKNEQITQLQLDNQQSHEIINQQGKKISTQEVIMTSNQDAIRALTDSNFNLKKSQDKKIKEVIAYYKGVTKARIDSVLVPYTDSLATKKWEDSVYRECADVINFYEKNSIIVPKPAMDSTKDYKIDLSVNVDGVKVNEISIPDSQYLRFVVLKGGLFKKDQNGKRHFILKQQVQVQVLHTNPYIHIEKQNSVFYSPPAKNRWLERGLLIGLGIFLGTKL